MTTTTEKRPYVRRFTRHVARALARKHNVSVMTVYRYATGETKRGNMPDAAYKALIRDIQKAQQEAQQ